jgi:hypothetical protein
MANKKIMKTKAGLTGSHDKLSDESLQKLTGIIYSDLFLKERILEKQLFSGEVSIKVYLKNKKLLKNILQA